MSCGNEFRGDRFRWTYDAASGLLKNNDLADTNPHCLRAENTDNRNKRQPRLGPCDANDDTQRWDMNNGMMRLRENPEICIMWNLVDRTRLWTFQCLENLFAHVVQ